MKPRIGTLVAITCAVVLLPTGVNAAGSEPTSGYATDATVTFYTNPRYISNPPSAGPEVAFFQDWGNPGLFLGKHDCDRNGGPMYKQSVDSWQPVAYTSEPQTFCVFTYSNSGPGNFGGTIAWD